METGLIKQVSKERWIKGSTPSYLCTLNYYPQDITDKYGIEFFEYEEFGLGKQLGAMIEISGTIYWLFAVKDESGYIGSIKDDQDSNNPNREALKVTVKIGSSEENTRENLDKLCSELGISESEVYLGKQSGRLG